MAATLGVATWSYAPYAVFSFVSPLVTIAIAYSGFRMLRIEPTTPQSGTVPRT
jgi:NhaC family Na+:H+ antiporter